MSSIISLRIELGTKYSTASIKSKGRVTRVRFPGEGYKLAHFVYWPDGETPVVGKYAIRAAFNHPKYFYALSERWMIDDANNQVHGGHSAVELASVLIEEVVFVACESKPEIEHCLSGQLPRDRLEIEVTHPDIWGSHQTDAIRQACELFDIEIDSFNPQPVAFPEPAATDTRLLEEIQRCVNQHDSIGTDDLDLEENTFVVDFGGGTVDVCAPTQFRYDLLAATLWESLK